MTPLSTPLDLQLGQLFSSNLERTSYTLNLYRRLYTLPAFIHADDVSPKLFDYCLRRNFFVNILAYQGDRIFLKRSFGTSLGWELPGGSVRSRGDELYEDAVSRIIERDIPNVEIGELRPVSYIEKTYRCQGRSTTHYGLTFLGRVRSPRRREIERNENIKGMFISIHDKEEISRIRGIDRRIVYHATHSLGTDRADEHIESLDDEIVSTRQISQLAHKLDAALVHPIGRFFSSRKIKHNLLSRIEETHLILDVACGDDSFAFELAKRGQFCVGNDIQWVQVHKLIDTKPSAIKNLVFTNHDACKLPFKGKFDVVLCKNMLHHMDRKEDLLSLLTSLRRVAKRRILIVDPERPSDGPWNARLWHWYYVNILNDQGERFLTEPLFRELISDFFREDGIVVNYDTIVTIKGKFMLAEVNLNPEPGEQGESPRFFEISGEQILERGGQNVKLVIFDLDGLIVDTESLFFVAMKRALEEQGVSISEEDYVKHDLQNGVSLVRKLAESGRLRDKEFAEKRLHEIYAGLLETNLEPMPGAVAAVRRLGERYRLALFTSSRSAYIDLILKKLDLGREFELIVSREMITKFKPDPEGVKKVLSELQVAPEGCVVIEDSKRGLRAAKAAGVPCIVIPNRLTESEDYSEADVVAASLNTLSVELIEGVARGHD
jgi:HAD superfamily hydrolase (TIGR01509 family)